MRTVTLTELQSRTEEYFEAIEAGEEIEVRRNGKPIAVVSPHPTQAILPERTAADPEAPDIEDEIEGLYEEIIELSRTAETGRDEAIDRAYARLLELQTVEAEKCRARFVASLNMPIDAGEKILARAQTLREKLEDLASSDTSATETNAP